MPIAGIVLIVNAVLLLVTLVIGGLMLNASTLYSLNLGDGETQKKYQDKILRHIVILVIVGITAAAFNLFFSG